MTTGDAVQRALPGRRDPRVAAALAENVAVLIRPFAVVVVVLYAVLDILYLTLLKMTSQPHWQPLLASDLFTIACFACLASVTSAQRPLLRRPQAVALMMIGVLYLNVAVLILTTDDPSDLVHLTLLTVGVTPLTLRGRTWALNVVASLGLLALYGVVHPGSDYAEFSDAVVVGIAVSFAWMYAQRATARRLVAAGAAQRQAAEEMAAALEQLEAVTESAQDAIITADDTGRITSWNAGAELALGYTREEAVGRRVIDLMPERAHSAHRTRYPAAAAGVSLKHRPHEVEMLHRDGATVAMEASVGTWYAHDGQLFFSAVLRDLTDRRLAEKARRDAAEQEVRRRDALQLHDSVAQGLAVALYALEMDRPQQAEDAVRTTLTAARRIITDALGDSDVATVLAPPAGLEHPHS